MTERKCKNWKHFSEGVSEKLRHEWSWSNTGRWCDGVCNLEFPRGYIGRKPPHPAFSTGKCFQFEERDLTLFEEGT